jgi:hypothetical protein
LSNNTNSTQALSTSIIRNINKTIAISANYWVFFMCQALNY